MNPTRIRTRLSKWHSYLAHSGVQRYLKNTGWMFAARITTLIISFFTIAVVARYLGPENLGKISYAQSFVAIFSVFASLGIDEILYRDLITDPKKEQEILGTAFLLKLVCGTATIVATTLTALMLHGNSILTWLIGIIALTFIFNPFTVVASLFTARVRSKYVAITGMFVAVILPLVKLLVVYTDKGVIYFAWVIVLESVLYAGFYIYWYTQHFGGTVTSWRVSIPRARKLALDAWPLLLVSITGYIYGRIDQIMINHYTTSSDVGIYSVVVQLTELAAWPATIWISTLFPALMHMQSVDRARYLLRWRRLGLFVILLATGIAGGLTLLAPFIVPVIYGNAYLAAVPLLQIYVWTLVLTTAFILAKQYLIAENIARIALLLSLIGAGLNVALNIILIPRYGAEGAAIATLITLGTIILSVLFFAKPRRDIIAMLHI